MIFFIRNIVFCFIYASSCTHLSDVTSELSENRRSAGLWERTYGLIKKIRNYISPTDLTHGIIIEQNLHGTVIL